MRNATILRVAMPLAVMAVLAFSVSAYAADQTWKTATGGVFETGTNWTSGNAPVNAADTATFDKDAGTAYTVTFDGSVGDISNAGLYVKTDKVILDLAGTTSQFAAATLEVGVGAGETGVLTIKGDGKRLYVDEHNAAYIGGDRDVTGTGTVTVQDGAELRTSTSHFLRIAYKAGSTGKLVVTGAGSVVDAFACEMGKAGSATLEIKEGGLFDVADTSFYTAQDAGSTASILIDGDDGAATPTGSTLLVRQYHHVGWGGTAVVDIQNGGQAIADNNGADWTIGTLTGSSGTVNVGVTGTGTWSTGITTLGSVRVGGSASNRVGIVNVGPGGTVATGDVAVWTGGTINLALGDWDITGNLTANGHANGPGSVKFEFNASDNGQITVSGTCDMSNVDIEFTGSGLTDGFADIDFIIAQGAFNSTGMTSSNLAGVMTAMGFDASDYTLSVAGGSNILRLHYVPEPATMVLLGLGGIGVLLRRRKK